MVIGMNGRGQVGNSRRIGHWAAVATIAAIGALAAAPSGASAACPMPSAPTTFSTSWGGGSGHYNNDLNWTNGAPSAVCDASITASGTYTVTMNAGSQAKSMTIGGAGSNPTLQISAENANTNLQVTAGGFLNIASGASLTLLCNVPPENCGAPNVSAPTITNAGTFTVDATVDGMPFISGLLTNTGTMQFNHTAKFDNGAVTNQGTFNIANGITVLSGGSSCGDTGVSFKNDTGGTLNATGTGTFDVINYEQGAGSTSGTNPVQKPCGTLKYTGDGASTVTAYGGFNLTGAMQAGQSLIVTNNSSNTNAVLGGNFTNNGTITLTCPTSSCGGPGFNIGGNTFTNAGTFTVAAPITTAGSVSGNLTNTGTMQFDGLARFDNGVVTNKGAINVADGKTMTSTASSCGDPGTVVKNDTGGSINSIGTGTVVVFTTYEQGAGTTSGTAPVNVACGGLKYTGTGASTVLVSAGSNMTGSVANGQTLRITGSVNSPAFSNAGTIVLDQSASNPTLNSGGTVTNTGTITTSGPSANSASFGGGGTIDQTGASARVVIPAGTKLNLGANPLLLHAGELSGGGTLQGSVDNQAGTVAPGASPGTLTIGGNYTQGADGDLEIEIEGTGAGQFDKLAVGGNATLGGTLALQPSAAYAASAAPGDSIELLSYGGTRTAEFASTTTNPSLACPNQFTAAYDDGAKKASATVSSSGAKCSSEEPPKEAPKTDPPPAAIPDTVLGTHPKGTVKTKKAKARVKFTFSSTVAGATFQCKLDKGAFAPCTSPKSYSAKPGKHTFTVQATSSGAIDPTPATFKFRVVKKKKKKH